MNTNIVFDASSRRLVTLEDYKYAIAYMAYYIYKNSPNSGKLMVIDMLGIKIKNYRDIEDIISQTVMNITSTMTDDDIVETLIKFDNLTPNKTRTFNYMVF